eukprot:TRINITY_DN35332_c0_g1_i1.p1 TRINITY_DN35332_c0_g1~~TRINITY_DN35332_c0_g1_i1.p1  ORF type:complete len:216 (+),score=40.81 TRINITY_DN35332_c0_g1_i1:79-648(+)
MSTPTYLKAASGKLFEVDKAKTARVSDFLGEEAGKSESGVIDVKGVGEPCVGTIAKFIDVFGDETALKTGAAVPQPLPKAWLETVDPVLKTFIAASLLVPPTDPYEHLLNTIQLASRLDIPVLKAIATATLVSSLRKESKEVIHRVLGNPDTCVKTEACKKAWLANREDTYEKQHCERSEKVRKAAKKC